MQAKELIDFEEEIATAFNNKEIKAPIHLHGNNEDQLIKIFESIGPADWIFSSWRSHYHCLLKGVPPDQLKKDIDSKNISLVAKWIPRETNKHKHLFKKLAESYYEHYIISAKSNDSIIKAKRKAYTNYKRIVTDLSKKLDVTQIKQCGQRYKDINYNNVTSITMSKQKNAFLNKKQDKSDDRIQGAKNFKDFIDMNIKLKKRVFLLI